MTDLALRSLRICRGAPSISGVAQAMRVGLSWVNTWFLRDLRTPFGGAGLSGIGREGGMHSINFYSELTNVCIQIDEQRSTQ